METHDLVMESTTDTPEQIREGLGLEPEPVIEQSADADTGAEGDATGGADDASPVVEAERPAKTEKPAAAVVEAGAKPVAGAKPKPTQKELDRVAAAARRDANAKNAVLEAEVKALRARLDQTLAPVVEPGKDVPKDASIAAEFTKRREALGPKPKQADFEDFQEFEDKRDEWLIAQGSLRAQEQTAHEGAARRDSLATADATRTWNEIMSRHGANVRAVQAKYADYDEAAKAADAADLRVYPHVQQAVLEDAEHSGELQYRLIKDPALVHRLNAMSPVHAAIEIGKLSATITAGPAKTPKVRPFTRAPLPTGTELGSHQSAVTDDLENATSQREYNAMRDKQDRARGRRR